MPERNDFDINFEVSPRLVTITSNSQELTVQDSHDTLSVAQDSPEGQQHEFLVSTTGGEPLGGGTFVGLTTVLNDVQVAFQSTPVIQVGSVTSTSANYLIDTSATFVTNGVKRGDWVINFTDQSVTEVLSCDSETQLTVTGLKEGSDNTFEAADQYKIWEVSPAELTGGNFTAVDNVGSDIDPLFPVFGRFATKTASSSATTQSQEQLEYSSFGGGVTLDAVKGSTGVKFPIGTGEFPVDNLADAIAIASDRGFDVIKVVGTYVFKATDNVDGFIFEGSSPTKVTMVLTADAVITNCIFRSMTINGVLDGGNQASFCIVVNLNYIDGSLLDCLLASGTITLNGAQANLLRCASASPMIGASPIIDMNGTGTDLVVHGYYGEITLKNHTSGNDNVSIDLSSGHINLDATITSGTYLVRGIGSLTDNSSNSTVVNELLDPTIINKQLDEMWRIQGLDSNNPMTVTPTSRVAGDVNQVISGNGVTTTTVTRS